MDKIGIMWGENFWVRIPLKDFEGKDFSVDDIKELHAVLESGYGFGKVCAVEMDVDQASGLAVWVAAQGLRLGTYSIVIFGRLTDDTLFRLRGKQYVRLVGKESQADAERSDYKGSSAYYVGDGEIITVLGREGLSAYEIAVLHGFEGDEAAWLESLKGDKGDTGEKGDKGDTGEKGDKGDTGEKGDTGATGPQGPQGNSGYQGAVGELEVVNNLVDGGEAAALSAEMGKRLSENLQDVEGYVKDRTLDITEQFVKAKTGKYIKDGIETTYSGAFISNAVSLKKDDVVTVSFPAQVNYQTWDILSKYDGLEYEPLYLSYQGSASIANGKVVYTLQEDCDVVVSLCKGAFNSTVFVSVYRPSNNDNVRKLTYRRYYEDWLAGMLSTWPGVGALFTFTGVSSAGTPHDYVRQCIECTEGERYVISTTRLSNNNNSLFFVVDADGKVLLSSGTLRASSVKDYEIIVPEGGKHLIVFGLRAETHIVYKKIKEPYVEVMDEDITNNHIIVRTPSKIIPAIGGTYNHVNLDSNNHTNLVSVIGGEIYRLSAWLGVGDFYGYAILDSMYKVIESVEFVEKEFTCYKEIEIPQGGCWLVYNAFRNHNYAQYSQKIVRLKRARSVVENSKEKEVMLRAMHARKTTSSIQTLGKRLTLSWTTDTHYDATNYRRWVDFTNEHVGVIDGALHTGDFNLSCDADNGFINTALKYKTHVPFIPVVGNHDAFGQTRKGTGDSLTSGSKVWTGSKYILPFMDDACVSGDDYCYYYRDFTAQKIRVIAINDYDKPRWADGYWITTTDEEEIASAVEWSSSATYTVGQVVHYKDLYLKCKIEGKLDNRADIWPCDNAPTMKTAGLCRYLDQAQVDFIINAMRVPAGWGIIFVGHQSFERVTASSDFVDEAWNSDTIFTTNKIEHKFGQNGYIMQDLITAYLKKTTLQRTYECITPAVNPIGSVTKTNLPAFYPDVTVDVDFSDAVGDVICFLNGHQHSDTCYYSSNCDGLKVLCIGCTTNCYGESYVNSANGIPGQWGSDDITRGGDCARDCFNVISFDTEEKAVYLLRMGADINNQFVKRDYIRISYAH